MHVRAVQGEVQAQRSVAPPSGQAHLSSMLAQLQVQLSQQGVPLSQMQAPSQAAPPHYANVGASNTANGPRAQSHASTPHADPANVPMVSQSATAYNNLSSPAAAQAPPSYNTSNLPVSQSATAYTNVHAWVPPPGAAAAPVDEPGSARAAVPLSTPADLSKIAKLESLLNEAQQQSQRRQSSTRGLDSPAIRSQHGPAPPPRSLLSPRALMAPPPQPGALQQGASMNRGPGGQQQRQQQQPPGWGASEQQPGNNRGTTGGNHINGQIPMMGAPGMSPQQAAPPPPLAPSVLRDMFNPASQPQQQGQQAQQQLAQGSNWLGGDAMSGSHEWRRTALQVAMRNVLQSDAFVDSLLVELSRVGFFGL